MQTNMAAFTESLYASKVLFYATDLCHIYFILFYFCGA